MIHGASKWRRINSIRPPTRSPSSRSVNDPSAIFENSRICLTFSTRPATVRIRKQLAREKIIEGLIGQLDGVVWSLVSINRPQSSKWLHASAKPTAFVYIETEGNRQLPYQTAQSIPAILTGCVPDLTPGSITVMDRHAVPVFRLRQSRDRRRLARPGSGRGSCQGDPRQARLDQGRAGPGQGEQSAHG